MSRLRPDRSIAAAARGKFFGVVVVLYTHLWILEGAFRKWVPGTDEIMYFARDGLVVIAIVYAALRFPLREPKKAAALFWLPVLALCIWALSAAAFGDTTVAVVLVGIRAYVAPFLLLYIVWSNELSEVWVRILRIVLFYAPIEAGLVVVQVLSPLASPINAAAGGGEGTFTTSDGIARATGTFTFTQGLTAYATLAVGITVACMLSRIFVARMVLVVVALASCIVMIAVSGSRGLVLTAALVCVVVVVHKLPAVRRGDMWRLAAIAAVALLSWLAVQTFLAQALEAFEARFENAAKSEDPVLRLADSGLGFIVEPFRFLGAGAGVHSQAGIAVGSNSSWLEDEPRRWTAELGILGYVLSLLSVVLGVALLVAALVGRRRWDSLVSGLAAVLGSQLLIGSITGTPSSQGAFAVAAAAMISLRYHLASTTTASDAAEGPPSRKPRVTSRRSAHRKR